MQYSRFNEYRHKRACALLPILASQGTVLYQTSRYGSNFNREDTMKLKLREFALCH